MYYLLYVVVSNIFLFDYKNSIWFLGANIILFMRNKMRETKFRETKWEREVGSAPILTLVVKMLVSASHWINHYSVDEY